MTMKLLRFIVVALVFAQAAFGGPPIACKWIAVPGSLFESLEPLREGAMQADDSPAQKRAALARLAVLRTAIQPGDALSLVKAGFWAATMHDVGVAPDMDGPQLILRAVSLRPDDPEYHVFAALAHMTTDPALFRNHWERARVLSGRGSATERNLKVIQNIYGASFPALFSSQNVAPVRK